MPKTWPTLMAVITGIARGSMIEYDIRLRPRSAKTHAARVSVTTEVRSARAKTFMGSAQELRLARQRDWKGIRHLQNGCAKPWQPALAQLTRFDSSSTRNA